ncbi:MAG: cytochrome c [Gemmatimonadota bacterium]|jgi:mono/diheme cytochrome c family protein
MISRTLGTASGMALAACLLASGACQKHEFEPPDRDQRIAQAEAQYAIADFDSIQWDSDSARSINGNIVYSSTCRRCHGSLGEGGTEYARSRDLDVPSLIGPEWNYDHDIEAVRHQIFVGHSTGMPTLGVASLTLREIDAVAWYTINVLRPDAFRQDSAR